MVTFGVVTLWLAILVVAVLLYRIAGTRSRTYGRFIAAPAAPGRDTPRAETLGLRGTDHPRLDSTSSDGRSDSRPVRGARRLARRWIWVPWLFGGAVALTIWLITFWPIQYILAIAAVVSLLASQLEGLLAARQVANLETQLADSIDIMVGALGAGAAVGPAIDAAAMETAAPLHPYLEEISGRIRLGDDPIEVFRSLADRVPLETFLLFSSALAVHWEVGGRLAPTLATVGRTIRDRIEVNRRIQSNIAQSQFSTFAIIGLIYMIALIVWRNGPEAMQEFVTSSVGSWFVAGSVMLQAVGIVWMNLISKPKF